MQIFFNEIAILYVHMFIPIVNHVKRNNKK